MAVELGVSLAKLCWQVLMCKDVLWSRVLLAKYGRMDV